MMNSLPDFSRKGHQRHPQLGIQPFKIAHHRQRHALGFGGMPGGFKIGVAGGPFGRIGLAGSLAGGNGFGLLIGWRPAIQQSMSKWRHSRITPPSATARSASFWPPWR